MATQNPTPATKPQKAPQCWTLAGGTTGRKGTKAQLLAVGVPAAWMHNLPAPGKKRETRWLSEGGCLVMLSVGERGVFHVQTLRMFDLERVTRQRGRGFARFMERAICQQPQG